MPSYEFTLVLSSPEESEEDVVALYEAGCDDGTVSTCHQVTRIDFEREARSLREAILSAVADVHQTKFRVARIESEATTTIAEINAELLTTIDGTNSPQ